MVVGGSAACQARWLQEEKGVSIPLLFDPGHAFRHRVGAAGLLGACLLDQRCAAAYARSLRTGLRPQRIIRDTTRSPGVVVLDRSGTVCWRHVGHRIGDYPPIKHVAAVVTDLLKWPG